MLSEQPQRSVIGLSCRVAHVVAIASLAAVVAILLLFLLYFHRSYFNSDDAVINMLAESMWEQGKLLPQGWINNNGDLMVPSGALIVAPLLRWFPNGFAVHALVGVISTVVLLCSLARLLAVLRIPSSITVLVVTLVASGISFFFAQMVFAQTTYFWWSAGFFVGATLICSHRLSYLGSEGRWKTVLPLSLLVFTISFANPSRVLLMMAVPLYALDWTLRRSNRRNEILPGSLWRKFIAAVGGDDHLTAVGLVLPFALALLANEILKLVGVTQAAYGAANLYWGGWPSVWKHAVTFYQGWFYYLGATEPAGTTSSALGSASRVLRYVIALALSVVGILEIVSLRTQRDILRRGMIIAFISGLVPILLLFLLFEPLAIDILAGRYFTVPIYILIILFAFRLRDFVEDRERLAACVFALFGIALIGISAQRFLPVSALGTREFWQPRQTTLIRLAALLEREGLKWGYATWWNAGATTVLADAAVRVTPIDLVENGVSRFGYMVLKDWYRPERWEGETFLALSRSQATAQRLDMLRLVLGPPRRTVDSPDYRVLVYERNIAQDFGCGNDVSLDKALIKGAPTPELMSAQLVAVEGATTPRLLTVRVRNNSDMTVGGTGRYPMAVGVQLLDDNGNVVVRDWNHTLLSCSIQPGAEVSMNVVLPATDPGNWKIRVDLVQEHIAWLGDWGVPPLDLPLVVDSAKSQASASP